MKIIIATPIRSRCYFPHPAGLMVLPELQEIRDWYVTSFQELREFHFSKPQPRSDDEPRPRPLAIPPFRTSTPPPPWPPPCP